MPLTLVLLLRSTTFTLRHSWPIAGLALGLAVVEFGLESALRLAAPSLATGPSTMDAAWAALFILIDSLINTVYIIALYGMIWARLGGGASNLDAFQKRLAETFSPLFRFVLLMNLLSLLGPLIWPIAVLLLYADIIIVFEKKTLTQALRKNFSLLFAQPWPALAIGLTGAALGPIASFGLHAAQVPEAAARAYSLATTVLLLPLAVAAVVLYLNLTMGRAPKGFPDFPLEDGD